MAFLLVLATYTNTNRIAQLQKLYDFLSIWLSELNDLMIWSSPTSPSFLPFFGRYHCSVECG